MEGLEWLRRAADGLGNGATFGRVGLAIVATFLGIIASTAVFVGVDEAGPHQLRDCEARREFDACVAENVTRARLALDIGLPFYLAVLLVTCLAGASVPALLHARARRVGDGPLLRERLRRIEEDFVQGRLEPDVATRTREFYGRLLDRTHPPARAPGEARLLTWWAAFGVPAYLVIGLGYAILFPLDTDLDGVPIAPEAFVTNIVFVLALSALLVVTAVQSRRTALGAEEKVRAEREALWTEVLVALRARNLGVPAEHATPPAGPAPKWSAYQATS